MNHLRMLKLMIYRYAEIMKIEIMADCYFCGKDMLASGNKYNIVFLDYSYSDSNGLDTAKSLRETNNLCSIILMSTDASFTGDIFDVRPDGYLKYPVNEPQLFRVMNHYFHRKGCYYPLLIKSRADTVCLNTKEIVYIEADNKHCVIHLEGKSIECSKTMAYIYDQLPKVLFLKINRSFVINSLYINGFNPEEVFLKTGEKLYMSRNYRKEFKESYFNFINALRP